jgi:hypothetical protein
MYEAAEKADKPSADPVAVFMQQFTPAIRAAHQTKARLDRRIDALRVIEAIRMQAAADNGKLPESLAKITVVPVPMDSLSGRPFEFRRDGDLIELKATGLASSDPGLHYRIRIQD